MQNTPKMYNYTVNYTLEIGFKGNLTYLIKAMLLKSEKIYNVFLIFFLEIKKKLYICNRSLQQKHEQKQNKNQNEEVFISHPQ